MPLADRERVAAQILAALVSNGETRTIDDEAQVAVRYADALLRELRKTPSRYANEASLRMMAEREASREAETVDGHNALSNRGRRIY